jgi:putative transposase
MDVFDRIASQRMKRFFRSTRKLNQPGLISHITQRAAGKEPLFIGDRDRLLFIALLKEICLKYSIETFCFCLMPNHVHLLIRPEKPSLFDAMRDLFGRYGAAFNRKYERKGHLFGGPFRQAVCLDDGYLLNASLYIHMNPVRAGIAKDAVRYRWSSCKLFCWKNPPTSFVNPGPILRLLPGDSEKERKRYRELLQHVAGIPSGEVLEQEDRIARLGDRLGKMFPDLFRKVRQGTLTTEAVGLDLWDLDSIENEIQRIFDGYYKTRPENIRAKRYVIEQLLARGYTRKEIAEKLKVSRKTVYNLLHSKTARLNQR